MWCVIMIFIVSFFDDDDFQYCLKNLIAITTFAETLQKVPTSADGNTRLSYLSFQIVALKMTTVLMGIVPPRPSRSQKFPRSLQRPRLHAGPALPVAS